MLETVLLEFVELHVVMCLVVVLVIVAVVSRKPTCRVFPGLTALGCGRAAETLSLPPTTTEPVTIIV